MIPGWSYGHSRGRTQLDPADLLAESSQVVRNAHTRLAVRACLWRTGRHAVDKKTEGAQQQPARHTAIMGKHHKTPQKAKIHGAIEFLEAKGVKYTQKEVCEIFGVPKGSAQRVLRLSDRRLHHAPETPEPRGRKCIISVVALDGSELLDPGAQMRQLDQLVERSKAA